MAVLDVREHRLPDLLVTAAAVGVLAALTAASVLSGEWQPWWRAIAVAAAAFALMYVMAVVTDLGYGDVKLIAVIAGCAGYDSSAAAMFAVLAGFLTASIAAVALWVVTRQGSRALAVGPWLLLGAAAALAGASWSIGGGSAESSRPRPRVTWLSFPGPQWLAQAGPPVRPQSKWIAKIIPPSCLDDGATILRVECD